MQEIADETQELTPEEVESSEAEPIEQPEDWEHKYRTLQGKYNAEIGRLQKANAELEAKVAVLEKLIQSQPVSQQPQPPAELPEELKNLKETLPDLYEALVKHFVTKSEISELESKITSKVQTSTQRNFFAELNRLVPDWQEINVNAEFLEWLKQKEPFSRKTLHELMLEAYNDSDAEAVARFFIEFKNRRPTPAQGDLAPPRRQGVGGSGVSPRLIKREDIVKFYKDAALGKYSPERKAQLEKEILSAIQENRVID